MATNRKLDWLKNSSVKENVDFGSSHVYTDIKLDLRQSVKSVNDPDNVFNSIKNRGKDIAVLYDTDCIMHSLKTLFSTKPGDRVLVPEYGCRLYEYIGRQITDLLCESIKVVLKYAIETWEPRVYLNSLDVVPSEDENTVIIKLYLTIPEIKQKYNVGFTFDSSTGIVTAL